VATNVRSSATDGRAVQVTDVHPLGPGGAERRG
jgi:hypothetical protein